MPILCINTREELFVFRCDHIAYFRADHNYTTAVYINGTKQVVCKGLSLLEQQLSSLYSPVASPFVRIGRSLLVNTTFLMLVSVAQKRIVLSDCDEHTLIIPVSSAILRSCKNFVATYINPVLATNAAGSDMNHTTSDIIENSPC